ncbi:MAG TPA: MFS transporter [Kofleriaceae bacterium]|jgi:MFS family permease|nr:MFS transporter [Kofleriaceae bacterium]
MATGTANSPRNIALYFACQALVASSTSLLVAESAIVGAMLMPDVRLATLPAALQQLVTFLATYPASHVMARVGRRVGFSLGAVLGLLGGAAATLGILRGSFVLFCAGTGLVGGHAGFATFYRFAAAESVAPDRRERALGWVMSAGVLAAFLGPWLASRTKDLWSTAFAGSFAMLFVMAFLSLVLLQFLDASDAPLAPGGSRASLREIARKPAFLTFTVAGMVSGATMVFVMTATPLAMAGCHHGFDHTAHVIQWHVVAMFAPSFLTGRLVARFGASRIVLGGLSLCTAAAVVNASGTSVPHFQIGLFLLGLGWNFTYIGVTTTLARVTPEERATAQGLNDLLVFSAVAIASLLAGVVEHTAGWRVLNLSVLPPLVLVGLWIALRQRSQRNLSRRRAR